VVRLAMEQ
jgi:hypothetical protein